MGLSGHLADGMTRWDTLINPFSFIIAIGGFNLAKHWKQENKTINHLSGLSLRVYLFHANRYMRTIIMPQMINEWAESIPPPADSARGVNSSFVFVFWRRISFGHLQAYYSKNTILAM